MASKPSFGPSDGVGSIVEFKGLRGVADATLAQGLRKIAARTLRKLDTEFIVDGLALHYKVYKAKEPHGNAKFSVTAHLSTDRDTIVAKAHNWDIMRATDQALRELERRARDHKQSRMANRRERRRTAVRTQRL